MWRNYALWPQHKSRQGLREQQREQRETRLTSWSLEISHSRLSEKTGGCGSPRHVDHSSLSMKGKTE